MPAPVLQTVMGIGLESTYGTAVPASGWIPVATAPKPVDKLKYDLDKAWRGSMGVDYGAQPGTSMASYGFDSYVFPDSVGWALAGTLGDVVSSGGTNAGSSTTTTGSTTLGATVLPVTSATGITPGTVLLVDTAANQEMATVLSVASLNVTVTKPLNFAHASAVTVQPVTGPFTHTFSLYNGTNGQPPSYTITDWYSVNGRQYPGAVFSDCSFKITGDGLLSYNAAAEALPSVSLAGVKPTASYTSVKPLSGWAGMATIGGTPVSTLLSADINIKRKVAPINPVNGQQAPSNIWAADLGVSGKLDLVMNDDSQLLNYLNNTQPSLDINYAVGSGATATQMKLHMTNAAYTAAVIERSKEYVQVQVTFTALFNTTDIGSSGGYSPINVVVKNAVSPRTYK